MRAERIAAVSVRLIVSATATIAAAMAPLMGATSSGVAPDAAAAPLLHDPAPLDSNTGETGTCAAGPGSAGPLRPLAVDAGRTIGRLRSLQGVNGAPAPGMHKPPGFTFGGWNMPEGVDTSRGYREARIDLVRTHDAYGPGDIDARFNAPPPPGQSGEFNVSSARNSLDIYPDPDADPNDPRSYHFGPTDRLVASIVGVGAQAIFRLGRSETSDVTPPKNFDRYASIVEHIVLHYNRGWANGHHYGLRYWEIWNEPDLGKLFWGGTAQQYYELYAKLARAVKRADPSALVGGPTLAKPNDATPYRDGFLEFVRAEHVPLDFYSWHWYATDSDDPLDFVRIGRDVRARLDRFGFGHTLSVLDEWNYGLVYPLPSDAQRAAFVASALIYMQHAPIDLAALYRADNLFGRDGATPNETGAALIALGRLKDTPFELRTTGADRCGFAVEAGRSADGRTIQVLVSNYQIPAAYRAPRTGSNALSVPHQFEVKLLERRRVVYGEDRGYDLTVSGLAPGRRYAVERYRISAGEGLARVQHSLRPGGALHLRSLLPPPGVELVVIRTTH
jgi:xylan 1,4-beta-xylosidase